MSKEEKYKELLIDIVKQWESLKGIENIPLKKYLRG